MWSVTVSEGSGGGGNLTGMWSGTLYDPVGNPFSLQLQLTHVGTNVTGVVYLFATTSQGSGSYAAGQFVFNFQWPGRTVIVMFSGTYNPLADELSGQMLVGGTQQGTWRVRR
mgnify:CR=1 FL=1